MESNHVISDALFEQAWMELGGGKHWVAYNALNFFLDKGDMEFFWKEDEAREFSNNNVSDHDQFTVIYADSIISLMRQLPYGDKVQLDSGTDLLEKLFESFDWAEVRYDPLHDTVEASTDQEKNDLARLEILLREWEDLFDRNPEAALTLAVHYWEGHPMEHYKDDFITTKFELMNTDNLDYLKNNVRNHGFGETLGPELEAKIQQGVSEFTLAFKTEVNKRDMEATLYFKKSDSTDLYFFNKYDTRLKNEKDETLAQTFYINKGWGVTLKEAYNLLNGRAVHKELTDKLDQKYQAWIQLDFGVKDKKGNYERKQFHQNYGYDLKEALSYYPIKEMTQADAMKDLLKSLEKGNVQMVTLETPGKDVKVFIEANPQYKSINVYSNKMQRLDQDKREELMKKPEVGQEKDKGKDQSKGLGTEEQGEKKLGKGKKAEKVNQEDNGLVKKTRTRSPGKGMGV